MRRAACRRSGSSPLVVLAVCSVVIALAASLRAAVSEAFVSVASEASRRRFLSALVGGAASSVGFSGSASAELFQPVLPKKKYGSLEVTPEEAAKYAKEAGGNLGRISQLRDGCFPTDKDGVTAQIGTDTVIVWDPDAPCGDGKSFIHAAGRGDFAPMTAAAGPLKHKYFAASFETVKDYKDKVGTCFTTPTEYENQLSWEVAAVYRGGEC